MEYRNIGIFNIETCVKCKTSAVSNVSADVCDNVSVTAYRGCPNGNLHVCVTCMNLHLDSLGIVARINRVLLQNFSENIQVVLQNKEVT